MPYPSGLYIVGHEGDEYGASDMFFPVPCSCYDPPRSSGPPTSAASSDAAEIVKRLESIQREIADLRRDQQAATARLEALEVVGIYCIVMLHVHACMYKIACMYARKALSRICWPCASHADARPC